MSRAQHISCCLALCYSKVSASYFQLHPACLRLVGEWIRPSAGGNNATLLGSEATQKYITLIMGRNNHYENLRRSQIFRIDLCHGGFCLFGLFLSVLQKVSLKYISLSCVSFLPIFLIISSTWHKTSK